MPDARSDMPSHDPDVAPPHGLPVRLTVLVLFFLSGACGLVYEVVWMRMLTLVFGATAFATTTILASLFTGLALGGFWFGRVADRSRRPLRAYALLELGVGVFAFLMPVLLTVVTAMYVGVARRFEIGFYAINLVRFALAFVLLVLPAILMGGSLPMVVKFFTGSRTRLGRWVSTLYALNTIGAVVGTVAAGFFLILALGVRQAAYAAGILNLSIAIAAFLVDLRVGERPAGTEPAPAAPTAQPSYTPRAARLALWAVGLSGFCALALEVLWTRSLVYFLDNSTHAFTTILTAFLLGIGVGSLIMAPFIDRGRRLLAWLGFVEVLIGVSAIAAIPAIEHLTPVFERMADLPVEDPLLGWKWMGTRFATALTVVLVPTLLMGMAFPLATKVYAGATRGVGASLGDAYAVNTLGGVLGSFLAGFVLIPALGVQAGITLVAAVNVAIGVVLVLNEPGAARGVRAGVAALGAAVVIAAGVMQAAGDGMTLTSYYEAMEIEEIISYEEGTGATVKVYRDTYGDRILSINGFPVAGEPPEYQDAQKGLAHFPLLLSPVESPTVAIIGFGAGGTSWSVLRHDVTRVDCVELVPAVPRAAHLFPEVNHGVLDDPRYNLTLGDGRNHALVTDERYDVISIDATSPKMAGNGSLYTLDFYELLLDRLTDDGIVVQWIPHHLLSDREVRMTIRSFQAAFPHATLWFSPLRQNMVLVGTRERLEIDVQALVGKFADQAIVDDLASVHISSALDLLAGFVAGRETLDRFVAGVGLNTDNRPVLEFTPAMAYFVGDLYRLRNLLNFKDLRENVLGYLVNLGGADAATAAAAEVTRRYEAVAHSLDGDILRMLGERQKAILEYDRALRTDPSEKNWMTTVWRYEPGR